MRARGPDQDGARSDSYEYTVTNLRIGVTANSEVNIVWQPYGLVRTERGGGMGASEDAGIGGLEIRGKLNLFGQTMRSMIQVIRRSPYCPLFRFPPTAITVSARTMSKPA